MVLVNVLRSRLRRGLDHSPRTGLIDVLDGWRPYIQLLRSFPIAGSLSPRLHLPGEQVTPERYRPACIDRTSEDYPPIGVLRWHRSTLGAVPLCKVCFVGGIDARPGYGVTLQQ